MCEEEEWEEDECCGKGEGRTEGDDAASDGGCDDEAEDELLPPMNKLLTSKFGFVDDAGFADDETDADDEADGLPLTVGSEVGVATTDPKLFGASVFIGGTEAGDDDIVAVASSIEPKVIEEPTKCRIVSK